VVDSGQVQSKREEWLKKQRDAKESRLA